MGDCATATCPDPEWRTNRSSPSFLRCPSGLFPGSEKFPHSSRCSATTGLTLCVFLQSSWRGASPLDPCPRHDRLPLMNSVQPRLDTSKEKRDARGIRDSNSPRTFTDGACMRSGVERIALRSSPTLRFRAAQEESRRPTGVGDSRTRNRNGAQ
jgi:hypothetical protein